jgi:hypothetical protein
MHLRKNVLILSLAALALLLTGGALCVDFAFSRLDPAPFYDGSSRVWIHRVEDRGADPLAACRRAFDMGAAGVELDVRYDAALGEFVVSHDRPSRPGPSGAGRPLLLDEVFREVGGRGRFWVDIKDLQGMEGKAAAGV